MKAAPFDYARTTSVAETCALLHESGGEVKLIADGKNGSGDARYLGALAAIANAIHDALAPRNARIDTLPMRHNAL